MPPPGRHDAGFVALHKMKRPPIRPGGRSALGGYANLPTPHSSFNPNRKMSALMDASAIRASLTVNGPLTISSVIR
jgi:hypothetical protein